MKPPTKTKEDTIPLISDSLPVKRLKFYIHSFEEQKEQRTKRIAALERCQPNEENKNLINLLVRERDILQDRLSLARYEMKELNQFSIKTL